MFNNFYNVYKQSNTITNWFFAILFPFPVLFLSPAKDVAYSQFTTMRYCKFTFSFFIFLVFTIISQMSFVFSFLVHLRRLSKSNWGKGIQIWDYFFAKKFKEDSFKKQMIVYKNLIVRDSDRCFGIWHWFLSASYQVVTHTLIPLQKEMVIRPKVFETSFIYPNQLENNTI